MNRYFPFRWPGKEKGGEGSKPPWLSFAEPLRVNRKATLMNNSLRSLDEEESKMILFRA